MNRKSLGFLLVFTFLASPAWAATYKIDADHSTVGFRIRHLVSWVRGTFDTFEGTFEYEPGKPEVWKAEAVIQTASINTHVEKRDEHLRSADFFDAAKYPQMTFKSTGVTGLSGDSAKLHGLLTIHGVEKPVVLDLQIHGEAADPWGNTRAGFTATTTINRKEFGITWNQPLGTGKLLMGDDVEITLDIEGLKQ
ncbi:MAG: polyisoprenoid-binding protein [Candidatus Omnitrophica bacterium]|nr:polyisoprenoid-binding protein [Candidatus Omnitrophota bacterium]